MILALNEKNRGSHTDQRQNIYMCRCAYAISSYIHSPKVTSFCRFSLNTEYIKVIGAKKSFSALRGEKRPIHIILKKTAIWRDIQLKRIIYSKRAGISLYNSTRRNFSEVHCFIVMIGWRSTMFIFLTFYYVFHINLKTLHN